MHSFTFTSYRTVYSICTTVDELLMRLILAGVYEGLKDDSGANRGVRASLVIDLKNSLPIGTLNSFNWEFLCLFVANELSSLDGEFRNGTDWVYCNKRVIFNTNTKGYSNLTVSYPLALITMVPQFITAHALMLSAISLWTDTKPQFLFLDFPEVHLPIEDEPIYKDLLKKDCFEGSVQLIPPPRPITYQDLLDSLTPQNWELRGYNELVEFKKKLEQRKAN